MGWANWTSAKPPIKPLTYGVQVSGTPQQPNGHDCGVYTAMMADAVCQVISEMRKEEEGLAERDVHGVDAIRRVLKKVCRVH